MDFLEKDLEEIIYKSDKQKLCDAGLSLMFDLRRQVKIGNYGIADLIHYRRPHLNPYDNKMYKGFIEIIELKNKKIGVSTFFQALNYLQGIKTYLKKKGIENNYDYRITLIGRELDLSSSFCFLGDVFQPSHDENYLLSQSFTSVHLYKYIYSLNGIEFEEIEDYNISNKGF